MKSRLWGTAQGAAQIAQEDVGPFQDADEQQIVYVGIVGFDLAARARTRSRNVGSSIRMLAMSS
jgi:hypothetical protein